MVEERRIIFEGAAASEKSAAYYVGRHHLWSFHGIISATATVIVYGSNKPDADVTVPADWAEVGRLTNASGFIYTDMPMLYLMVEIQWTSGTVDGYLFER